MAKFTSTEALNIKLPGGFEISGASGATHRIPDSLAEEFERDLAPAIAGFAWVTQDEASAAAVDISAKYDKTGGTISGSVTATGSIAADSMSAIGAVVAAAFRAKGAPWFDVTGYGATGDGTTDDLAAFDAATTACATAGGGIIHIPAGSYYLSAEWEIDVDAVHVELDPDATVFTTASTVHGGTIGFVGGGYGLGVATTPKNTWASIHGGTIYNTNNSTADNAVGFVRYSNAICDGVRITTAGRKGITAQYGVDHVRIVNNIIGTTGMGGITLEVSVTDAVIEGNYIGSAGAGKVDDGEAAAIAVLAGCENVRVRNNTVAAAGSFGIRVTSTTSIWIEGNRLPQTVSNAISIATASVVHIADNELSSARYGIAVTGVSSGLAVQRNNIVSAGSSASATYDAYYFDSCAVAPIMSGNRLAGSGHRYAVNAVSMASVGAVSFGNILTSGASGIYGGTKPDYLDDYVDGVRRKGADGLYIAVTYGTAAPTTGAWAVGDLAWNTSPTATGTLGWVCTTAGTPGTWTRMMGQTPSSRATYTAGNITTATGGGIKVAMSTTGLDVSVAAAAGDVLEYSMSILVSNDSANEIVIDVATLVSGSLTNYISGGTASTRGLMGLYSTPSVTTGAQGLSCVVQYVVQSGDISSGTVTLRPVYIPPATNAKTIYASSTYPIHVSVKNLGQ